MSFLLARTFNSFSISRGKRRRFYPWVKFDLHPTLLREVEVICGIVRVPELSLIPFSLEFSNALSFLLHGLTMDSASLSIVKEPKADPIPVFLAYRYSPSINPL